MKGKVFLFSLVTAFLILSCAKASFAQDSMRGGAVPESSAEGSVQWVWGDVISADAQSKMLKVKYLDYETDQEQEMGIAVDDKTTYENVKSLEEVRPNDVVSIDYIAASDGGLIAKNISVEKAMAAQGTPEETPPMEEQPVASPEEEVPVSP